MLASLGLVAWLALRDIDKASPGALHPTHQQVPTLDGVSGCVECHGESEATMAEACGACHTAVADQIEGSAGLHGQLDEALAEHCSQCHVDHQGDGAELVSTLSFRLAGIDSLEAYAHSGLDYELDGIHSSLECTACHVNAEVAVLAIGMRRFGGLEQSCESCHAHPHPPDMPGSCNDCHGQDQPFADVARFDHAPDFPLEGAHAGLACVECHSQGSPYSIDRYGLAAPPERDCATCHSPPHAPAQLVAWESEGTAESCAACHPTLAGGFGADLSRMEPAAHIATGFPLGPPHAELGCSDCHLEGPAPWQARFPGREVHDCRACHGDPHGGQFDSLGDERSCLECHSAHEFTPSTVDHALTAFPLQGPHKEVACSECHLPALGTDFTRYAGTPQACADCHTDVHRGFFASRYPLAEAQTDCALCHLGDSPGWLVDPGFDHGSSTGFALEGSHATAECSSCHTEGTAASVRRLGFLADILEGSPQRCASCHEDPHGGRFALPHGEQDCGVCHRPTHFREVEGQDFDHGRWTGFPLQGAHLRNECTTCHIPPRDGPRLGKVADHFPGPAERCETCHVDPHGGSFLQRGGSKGSSGALGCARCHTQEGFSDLDPASFDHGAWTGFPLEGAHGSAACAACHAPLDAPDFLGRRSARAQGASCSDCHGDPHLGQFAASSNSNCTDCHTTQSFTQLSFDHALDARFALDATHAALDCDACHQSVPTADGRQAVRYRPLGTACADCHTNAVRRGDKR